MTVEGEIAVVDPTGVVLPRVARRYHGAAINTVVVSEIVDKGARGRCRRTSFLGRAWRDDATDARRATCRCRRGAGKALAQRAGAGRTASGARGCCTPMRWSPAPGDIEPRQLRSARAGEAGQPRRDRGARPCARRHHRRARRGPASESRGAHARDDSASRALGRCRRRTASATRCLASTSSYRSPSWACSSSASCLPGQGMLTTTIEEKSNRVIEVLLSAVSPMRAHGRQATRAIWASACWR